MHCEFLKKFLRETLDIFWVLAVSKEIKWWKCSNIVIHTFPPFVFNSTHRGLSCHKCCHHKILANLYINFHITLQFQYFWDFNNCPQAIFSQLSFENFWLYLLGARLFWLKIIKNYYKSPLKVCELKAWVK